MNSEIRALFTLIDDPDDEVYDTVVSKLMNYGAEIIQPLEQLWEVTADEAVQQRIEQLIHRVQFQDLQSDFHEWSKLEHPDLLRGAILVARYHYPQLNVSAILNQFDKIRKNVWLELNNYMVPLEQVNVFNSILYNYYKLQGHELTQREPDHFFINKVLESHKGNAYSIGVLYLALCELLDIPVFAVDIPRQFIFAYIYMHPELFAKDVDDVYPHHKVQFFIDPVNGAVYSQNDVDAYLKKINATDRELYMNPLLNKRIIYKMLEELCLCYKYRKEADKAQDIESLMQLLGDGTETLPDSDEEGEI
jgi:regulator of sirC expression with transglutaminase-like and TPR domain